MQPRLEAWEGDDMVVSKTQGALQRRLGRMSMLIEQLDKGTNSQELAAQLRKELDHVIEITARMELDPGRASQDGQRKQESAEEESGRR